jgi:hypothetical protein
VSTIVAHSCRPHELTLQSRLAVLVPEIDGTIATDGGKCTLNRVELDIVDAIYFRRFAVRTMTFERKVGSVRRETRMRCLDEKSTAFTPILSFSHVLSASLIY